MLMVNGREVDPESEEGKAARKELDKLEGLRGEGAIVDKDDNVVGTVDVDAGD
jgi:hypothetical protein